LASEVLISRPRLGGQRQCGLTVGVQLDQQAFDLQQGRGEIKREIERRVGFQRRASLA